MSNVSQFRRYPDFHGENQSVVETPDPERLKELVREAVEATTSTTALPDEKEIRIRNFRSAKYELADDLLVVLEERGGDQYVATSYDTGQYGHGYSPDAALHHLCSVLEDYYELLLEDEDRLSERLDAHLRYLRSILRVRE